MFYHYNALSDLARGKFEIYWIAVHAKAKARAKKPVYKDCKVDVDCAALQAIAIIPAPLLHKGYRRKVTIGGVRISPCTRKAFFYMGGLVKGLAFVLHLQAVMLYDHVQVVVQGLHRVTLVEPPAVLNGSVSEGDSDYDYRPRKKRRATRKWKPRGPALNSSGNIELSYEEMTNLFLQPHDPRTHTIIDFNNPPPPEFPEYETFGDLEGGLFDLECPLPKTRADLAARNAAQAAARAAAPAITAVAGPSGVNYLTQQEGTGSGLRHQEGTGTESRAQEGTGTGAANQNFSNTTLNSSEISLYSEPIPKRRMVTFGPGRKPRCTRDRIILRDPAKMAARFMDPAFLRLTKRASGYHAQMGQARVTSSSELLSLPLKEMLDNDLNFFFEHYYYFHKTFDPVPPGYRARPASPSGSKEEGSPPAKKRNTGNATSGQPLVAKADTSANRATALNSTLLKGMADQSTQTPPLSIAGATMNQGVQSKPAMNLSVQSSGANTSNQTGVGSRVDRSIRLKDPDWKNKRLMAIVSAKWSIHGSPIQFRHVCPHYMTSARNAASAFSGLLDLNVKKMVDLHQEDQNAFSPILIYKPAARH